MNPKPNLLRPFISHLQKNMMSHNIKSNDNNAINAAVTKLLTLLNCKIT